MDEKRNEINNPQSRSIWDLLDSGKVSIPSFNKTFSRDYDESLSLDTIILYLDSNQNEVRINKTYNITDKILKIIIDDLIHYYDPVIPRDLNIKYL